MVGVWEGEVWWEVHSVISAGGIRTILLDVRRSKPTTRVHIAQRSIRSSSCVIGAMDAREIFAPIPSMTRISLADRSGSPGGHCAMPWARAAAWSKLSIG